MRSRLPRLLPLLALAGVLLSGCASLTGEDTSTSASLFGVCPQWVQAPGLASQHVALPAIRDDTTYVKLVAPAGSTYNGHGLDIVQVRITNLTISGGAVAVRAYSDANGVHGGQLGIRSFRGAEPAFVPVLAFASAAHTQREFEVPLGGIDAPPAAAPLWLGLTNEGNHTVVLDLTAQFEYRVCGL